VLYKQFPPCKAQAVTPTKGKENGQLPLQLSTYKQLPSLKEKRTGNFHFDLATTPSGHGVQQLNGARDIDSLGTTD